MNRDSTAPFDTGTHDPALCAGEAKVFAEAALRMLAQGETSQAAFLLRRAAGWAELA